MGGRFSPCLSSFFRGETREEGDPCAAGTPDLAAANLAAVDKTALRAYIKSLFGPLKEKSIKRKL
jgi:hypothetical protein